MHQASGWCEGCLRTLDEIAGWASMSEHEQRVLCQALRQRRRVWRQRHSPLEEGGQ
jgi:predicted Fe-S protein YdhL (DUF1289 family)